MRLTSDTAGALLHSDGTCTVFSHSRLSFEPEVKVIEFPKVWREHGRQYKVTECDLEYCRCAIARIPKGSSISYGWHADKVEEY